MTRPNRRLFLFDVDGTLCASQQKIAGSTIDWLRRLSEVADIGLVSGSDKEKVLRQFGVETQENLLLRAGIRYVLFENAVQTYRLEDDGTSTTIHQGNVVQHLGEDYYQDFVNFCLKELSEIKLPVKRDLMIETRSGNINVCPIGRRCTQAERLQFAKYDTQHNIRVKLAQAIRDKFGDKLHVCLGGQISIDVAPHGWSKALALKILAPEFYPEEDIYFFGDNCGIGGNDEPLYLATKNGFWVKDETDCQHQVDRCLETVIDS